MAKTVDDLEEKFGEGIVMKGGPFGERLAHQNERGKRITMKHFKLKYGNGEVEFDYHSRSSRCCGRGGLSRY